MAGSMARLRHCTLHRYCIETTPLPFAGSPRSRAFWPRTTHRKIASQSALPSAMSQGDNAVRVVQTPLPGWVLTSQAGQICVAAHAADPVKIVSTMRATFQDAIPLERVIERAIDRVIDGRFPLLQKLGGTEWSSAYLTELDDGRAQKAAIKIFPFASVD